MEFAKWTESEQARSVQRLFVSLSLFPRIPESHIHKIISRTRGHSRPLPPPVVQGPGRYTDTVSGGENGTESDRGNIPRLLLRRLMEAAIPIKHSRKGRQTINGPTKDPSIAAQLLLPSAPHCFALEHLSARLLRHCPGTGTA